MSMDDYPPNENAPDSTEEQLLLRNLTEELVANLNNLYNCSDKLKNYPSGQTILEASKKTPMRFVKATFLRLRFFRKHLKPDNNYVKYSNSINVCEGVITKLYGKVRLNGKT